MPFTSKMRMSNGSSFLAAAVAEEQHSAGPASHAGRR